MSGRRLIRYLAVVSAVAGLACGDYAALTGPTPRNSNNMSAPHGAAFGRYILISGVTVCVEGCMNEAKNKIEQKNILSVSDTLK